MSEKRKLNFHTPGDVAAEITRLRRGYAKVGGSWTLEQVCDHCAKALQYLDQPVATDAPTDEQKRIQSFLNGLIASRGMDDGRPLPPGTDPAADAGPEAVDRFLRGLQKLESHPQTHVTFSTVGTLSIEQFRQFIVVHTQHHLNFFQPTA